MDVHIQEIHFTDAAQWDAYVHAHPRATLYHLYAWRNVIEKTYGHKTYYLAATKDSLNDLPNTQSPKPSTQYPVPSTYIVGLLPLVHLKHFLFGNSLISMPFVDLGGILADDEETEQALLNHAIKLGKKLGAATIELRCAQPLSFLRPKSPYAFVTKSHKVRMSLDLLTSEEELMRHFKPRLRTKIRKSLREDLTSRIGGPELIDDFYKVFSVNMRDLGSPVHSKRLIENVLHELPVVANIVMVYWRNRPVACSLVIGFNHTLESPWVSSLRKFSHLNPNIRLYWTMIEFARHHGYSSFEFGRSSPDEGPYRFKKQWRPKGTPLNWQYISLNAKPVSDPISEKSKLEPAIRIWQKLPVSVATTIGPMIRQHIGL